mgnify:CR=1 FL=1|jgi:hypothetical protein
MVLLYHQVDYFYWFVILMLFYVLVLLHPININYQNYKSSSTQTQINPIVKH